MISTSSASDDVEPFAEFRKHELTPQATEFVSNARQYVTQASTDVWCKDVLPGAYLSSTGPTGQLSCPS